jgi:hypothetical protein
VAALLSAGLLGSGSLGTVGPAAGLVAALGIMAGAHISLHTRVAECTLSAELANIPQVARHRRKLCSSRRRRGVAASLRWLALASRGDRANPFVVWDRVSTFGEELLALARELEEADTVDPHTMVQLDRLLCDGSNSPLLNEQLPESELASTLRCIRFRLVMTASRARSGETRPTADPGTSTAANEHRCSAGRARRALTGDRLGIRRR